MNHEHHQLELEAVSFHYSGKEALHDITFSVHCGQRLALLGPNGAGKSTLVRLLAGLLPPQSGTLKWREESLARARREIAYLPQIDQHQRHFPIRVRDVVAMGPVSYTHLTLPTNREV